VYTPPVVCSHIEDTECNNEDGRGPFGFETNSNHNARDQSKQRKEGATDAPLALKDKSKE
jgi:hypothetical protein